MYAGRVVEEASIRTIFHAPAHPYTRALIDCLPRADGVARLGTIAGVMPGLRALPPGCRFHPRCPVAEARCSVETPPLRSIGGAHLVACALAVNGGPPRAPVPGEAR
jgi:oligopeptide/dipeptide ABC transporter ATP-binding protein